MVDMIDLSLLAAPALVEQLDFETILAQCVAQATAALPDLAETLALESEPVNIVLQVLAYRELLLRQRINEAAQALMLSYATSTDLDQIGGNYGIPRLVIDPGNTNAVPPVAPVLEGDGDFRTRILQSLERFSTAGSAASYVYHAMTASGDVLDASAVSPVAGQVTVYVLARDGDGTASAELLATVAAALNADTVRPMTDLVTVLSASIVPYAITATLLVSNGPDAETIRATAVQAAQAYVEDSRRLGVGVALSGVYRALHQPGVLRAELAAPTADVDVSPGQAARCTAINVTVAA